MKLRNMDVGRYITVLFAVVLILIMPLKYFASSEQDTVENNLQAKMDEITGRIKENREITVDDYEELLFFLAAANNIYDIELELGRNVEDLSAFTVSAADGGIVVASHDDGCACHEGGHEGAAVVPCASHVHTQDCYIGHNHKVNGCSFDGKHWSCGIDNGDNNPICDEVVVDVKWDKEQKIEAGNSDDEYDGYTPRYNFDGTLELTYLNGNVREVEGTVPAFDEYNAGTRTVYILYNAYYFTAYMNTKSTMSFSVELTVVPDVLKCSNCGLKYDATDEGKDPGCPVCSNSISRIAVQPSVIYAEYGDAHALDGLQITGYFRDDLERPVTEYTTDYDCFKAGMQSVRVTVEPEKTVKYTRKGVEYTADVSYYNGVPNRAFNIVNVYLIKKFTCPVCGTSYECAEDGSDPGCPYCNGGILSIYAVPQKTVYNLNEEISVKVYAQYRDGSVEIPREKFTDNFNSQNHVAGLHMVRILYEGHMTTFNVTVVDPYEKVCPICGNMFNSRLYATCPNCARKVVGIRAEAVPSVLAYGEPLGLNVWVMYGSGEMVLTHYGYTFDGYDECDSSAPQNVTVYYEGFTDNVVVTVMPPKSLPTDIVVCDNGHFYKLNEDGSDPGCPYCSGAEEITPDKMVTYTEMMYTSEIVALLNSAGSIKLNDGDTFTIKIMPAKSNTATKVANAFIAFRFPKKVFTSGIAIGKD